MVDKKKCIWFVCFILSMPCFSAFSDETGQSVHLSDACNIYPLGRHIEYLLDDTGNLTISDVASQDNPDIQFLQSRKRIISLGITEKVVWLRIRLENGCSTKTDWRLILKPSSLDRIDLWLPDETGQFFRKKGGDRRPFKIRDVEYHYTVFKLDLPVNSERTVYLRVQTRDPMIIDPALWHADTFHSHALHTSLFLGVFFGALLIMIAYNLFLFGALKDPAYLHYVLFLFFMTMQFATLRYGLSFQYLWPDSPEFNQIAPFLFSNLMMFFAINFVLAFLNTKTLTPVLHRWLKRFRIPFPLFALASVFAQGRALEALVGLTAMAAMAAICLMVGAGILAWRKGYRPARYYLLAWGLFWLNTTVAAVHISGLLVIQDHARFLPVVVAAMVLLLSLALADRINLMKRETATAEAASNAKSAFLAHMSHELRTPLNAILGFSRILSQSHALAGEDKEHLAIILRNGEHLLSLINQVLDLSKIEAGKMTLNDTCFDLHGLLDGLVRMFLLKAQEKNLDLNFERETTVPGHIVSDEVKLRQILINLLRNAVKFTEKGQVSLRVRTAHKSLPPGSGAAGPLTDVQHLIMEVQDTGIGISQAELGTLFIAFEQTESGRQKTEGTGLGLEISRRFARMMGGDIHVKSRPGQGSVFTVEIPVRTADGDVRAAERPCGRIPAPGQDLPQFRLLIADDRPDNRKLLAAMLRRFGFNIGEAADGKDAVKVWQAWRPHLIWMDLRMPLVNGYEAAKEIRKMESESPDGNLQPPVKIIAMTAGSYGREDELISSCGWDGLVRKPFGEDQILDVLETHLGIRFESASNTSPAASGSGAPKTVVSPDRSRMDRIPTEWVDALEKGAGEADFILLSDVTERIREYDPGLFNELESMVKEFRYRDILEMIRSFKTVAQKGKETDTDGKGPVL